jgi:hypothetical protein
VIRPACAIVLALALSSGASAQTQDERFAEIDRNRDGLITYEEHAASERQSSGRSTPTATARSR